MALESICLSWMESFGGVFQSGFCALLLFQQPARRICLLIKTTFKSIRVFLITYLLYLPVLRAY